VSTVEATQAPQAARATVPGGMAIPPSQQFGASASDASGSPPLAETELVQLCMVRDGELRSMAAVIQPATGDTLLGGVPFREAPSIAPFFAAAREWLVRNETFTMRVAYGEGESVGWVRFGDSIRIRPELLAKAGNADGMPIFAEAGYTTNPDVLYIATGPDCTFQRYQRLVIRRCY
jgi:hypothetical protein